MNLQQTKTSEDGRKYNETMELIKATKGGKTAVFATKVWATGQPQRYGWRSDEFDVPAKTLPAEILEFAEIRKRNVQPVNPEPILEPIIEPKPKPNEPTNEIVKAAAKPKPKRKAKKK